MPISLPSALVKRRPGILAAEANLHATSAAIGVATANLYPRLTLSANMMQEALAPAGLFSTTNSAWSLAARLKAPLFNGGTITTQKRAVEHAYQASLAHDDEAVAIMNDTVNSTNTALN